MQKSFNIPNNIGFEATYYINKGDNISIAKIFPQHSHDVLEIYFHIDGNASFVVENDVYTLSPCDCIIARPNEVHNCILHSASLHKHACIWINSPSCFAISPFLMDRYDGKNLISPSEENKKNLLSLFDELDCVEDDFNRYTITLNILKILHSSLHITTESLAIPETLKNILSYISENFTKIQNVNEIIDKFYISKSTLLRMFKKYLNTTPKIHLETKKLTYSRLLLKRGESVEDACFLSGFPDYSNYIRLFKKKFNVTPGKYKLKSVTIF